MSIGLFARLEKFGIVALAKRYSSEERRPTVGKKFGFSCHQMLMKKWSHAMRQRKMRWKLCDS